MGDFGGYNADGTAKEHVDQIGVMRPVNMGNSIVLPDLVARIPVGYLDDQGKPDGTHTGSVNPYNIAVTPDNTRLYVSLRWGAGVAVIDTMTMRQIDVLPDDDAKPETNGINVITFNNTTAAHPFDIVIDPTGSYAYVSDEMSPNGQASIYVIDIDPYSATYNRHIATLTFGDLPKNADGATFGLRGLTITPDGTQLAALIPTQAYWNPGNPSASAGKIAIIDLPNLTGDGATKDAPTQVTPKFLTSPGSDPTSIRAVYGPQGEQYLVVLDRSNDGSGIVIYKKQENAEWQQSAMYEVALTSPFAPDNIDSFDLNNAIDVVFTSDLKYGFVYAQNKYVRDVPSHDPDVTPSEPAGSNIGIIRDPFKLGLFNDGYQGFVAATRMIPYTFGEAIALSADEKYLYGSYTGQGAVFAFDAQAMITEVEAQLKNFKDQGLVRPLTYNWAIDDLFTPGASQGAAILFDPFTRSGVNPLIDIRADYAQYPLGLNVTLRASTGTDPVHFTDGLDHGPIRLGGLTRGMAVLDVAVLAKADTLNTDDSKTVVSGSPEATADEVTSGANPANANVVLSPIQIPDKTYQYYTVTNSDAQHALTVKVQVGNSKWIVFDGYSVLDADKLPAANLQHPSHLVWNDGAMHEVPDAINIPAGKMLVLRFSSQLASAEKASIDKRISTPSVNVLSATIKVIRKSDNDLLKIDKLFYMYENSDDSSNAIINFLPTLPGRASIVDVASDLNLRLELGKGDAFAIGTKLGSRQNFVAFTPADAASSATNEDELSIFYGNRLIGKLKLSGEIRDRQLVGLNLSDLRVRIESLYDDPFYGSYVRSIFNFEAIGPLGIFGHEIVDSEWNEFADRIDYYFTRLFNKSSSVLGVVQGGR